MGDGKLRPELRQWGFIVMVNGKTVDPAKGKPKNVRKDVFNALSERLTSSFMWKWPFKERRCLIPMSSWDEWPEKSASKQRVRVSMPSEPVFLAAGLYELSTDPTTCEKVPTYTIVAVPPNKFLGTVHDRAPLILDRMDYDNWLFGDVAQAQALCGVPPDSSRYDVRPAQDEQRGPTAPPPGLF